MIKTKMLSDDETYLLAKAAESEIKGNEGLDVGIIGFDFEIAEKLTEQGLGHMRLENRGTRITNVYYPSGEARPYAEALAA